MNVASLYKYQGKEEALLNEKRHLIQELDAHEQVVAFEKDGYALLDSMQERFAQQSVGLYSELLTAIVRDVMGERGPEIKLEPLTYANQPALNIYGINNGEKEDVVESQGGSINNLLSAGFRFIALALSSERRFVVLDEPDCWLEVDLVPRFIQVLDKLCEEMGVQAVFISHHADASELPIYKLKLALDESDGVTVEVNDERDKSKAIKSKKRFNAELLNDVGIRSIELMNYMSHRETNLPLSPGLTTIIGANHIGKSVITRGVSDLLTNNRLNARIRHKESVASISMTIENGVEVLWFLSKGKAGKPKATYTIKSKDGEIIDMVENANEVPSCVTDHLQMTCTGDGLDFHVSPQKDPLFVLNPAISKHRRAEVIDLGYEYEEITKAIKQHRENVLNAKREIRKSKERLDRINVALQRLDGLSGVITLVNTLEGWEQRATERQRQMQLVAGAGMLDNELRQNRECMASVNLLDEHLSKIESRQGKREQQCILLEGVLSEKRIHSERDAVTLIDKSMQLVSRQAGRSEVIHSQLSKLNRLQASEVISQKSAYEAIDTIYSRNDVTAVRLHRKLVLLMAAFDMRTEIEKSKTELTSITEQIGTLEKGLHRHVVNAKGECPLCHQQISSVSAH